jgi:chromosome segregation protein
VHLKSIEISGFKSFAEKTKLAFEPGMTAIVGPNGCGKSNVSDAIRWVLGEQSAKALRGSKMEDCIFNGTQNRKPLGMAEVSITFTNCEEVLKTEFHEVTITRRVFRSGEGQYFINKTPCRLRDIQRLFMDTGVGTSSYSFMAQGRIDQILSARPEDRRAIFEEASGITKYKADKTEALRKLAHTEANLLRLADVIREVKRQIGSLQRQAGKARRYKDLKEEMRILDLYAARCRIRDFDRQRNELELQIKNFTEQAAILHATIEQAEADLQGRREEILQVERNISSAMEAMVQAQSRLDRTQDQIRMNQQRIAEYRVLAERDTREVDELTYQLQQRTETLITLDDDRPALEAQRSEAKAELDRTTALFDSHRLEIDSLRRRVQKLREETVSLESRASRVHNELMQIDNQERTTIIKRERLTAEKQQFTAVCEDFTKRIAEQQNQRTDRQRMVETALEETSRLDEERKLLAGRIAETQQQRAQIQSKLAGFEARVEMLADEEEVKQDFPGGAQLLLDPANPLNASANVVLGPLSSKFSVPEAYTRAV